MSKIVIRPKKLHKLAKEFLALRPAAERNLEGGRPQAYPDDVILTMISIQKLGDFSFRETLEYCGSFFSDIPSLSTYHERLQTFPQKLRKEFLSHLGR